MSFIDPLCYTLQGHKNVLHRLTKQFQARRVPFIDQLYLQGHKMPFTDSLNNTKQERCPSLTRYIILHKDIKCPSLAHCVCYVLQARPEQWPTTFSVLQSHRDSSKRPTYMSCKMREVFEWLICLASPEIWLYSPMCDPYVLYLAKTREMTFSGPYFLQAQSDMSSSIWPICVTFCKS